MKEQVGAGSESEEKDNVTYSVIKILHDIFSKQVGGKSASTTLSKEEEIRKFMAENLANWINSKTESAKKEPSNSPYPAEAAQLTFVAEKGPHKVKHEEPVKSKKHIAEFSPPLPTRLPKVKKWYYIGDE